MRYSSIDFDEAFQKKNPEKMLVSLNKTVNRIVNSCFSKFCNSVDSSDISQEVLVHLWNDVLNHPDKNYLVDMDSSEAYLYLTTTIKGWVGRVITRSIRDNVPYTNKNNKIPLFITLSVFNIEYNQFSTEADIEMYINSLRENCNDLLNGKRVLDYLAPRNDEMAQTAEEYAGFSPRTFYKAVKALKKRAHELL